MRALWLEDEKLKWREDAAVEPQPGEAVVRVTHAGICNTDVELVRGYYPFTGVLGHEFVGVVESAKDPAWIGRRVVGEINACCGACSACKAGRNTHCERRTVLGIKNRHGAFGESLSLPLSNLHAVPEDVSDEAAVFVEPLAAALEIQQQVRFEPGQRVVVIGDGKLGQLVARTLALTGASVTVVGRHKAKLEALEAAGIPTVSADELPDRRADVVVECTGNEDGLALALEAVRPGGTVVLKSTYRGAAKLNMSAVVVDEVSLVGSRCGPFAPALSLLADKRIDVTPLIHARYPMRDGVAALEHAQKPGVLKVLLEP